MIVLGLSATLIVASTLGALIMLPGIDADAMRPPSGPSRGFDTRRLTR